MAQQPPRCTSLSQALTSTSTTRPNRGIISSKSQIITIIYFSMEKSKLVEGLPCVSAVCHRAISFFICRRCPRAGFYPTVKSQPLCWSLAICISFSSEAFAIQMRKDGRQDWCKFVLRRCFQTKADFKEPETAGFSEGPSSPSFFYFIFTKPTVNKTAPQNTFKIAEQSLSSISLFKSVYLEAAVCQGDATVSRRGGESS